MKQYDVIIIGAGPSGIFCAYELIHAKKNLKILIIEKGRRIEKRECPKRKTKVCVGCKPCSITTGFAGAGAFSDGKLSLSPDVRGNLPEIGDMRMDEINPKDYKRDARGNLVAVANIREIDLLRDELVMELVGKANGVAETLADFKRGTLDDIAAFVQLSADRYDVQLGGRKGNVSLHSFDGQYRVQLAMQDTLVFDEGLAAAKALIDECINEWTAGSRTELKTLINAAFQVDKEGNISTARVLGLRRLAIDDAKWRRAMDALSDSLQVHTSKAFVRVYRRDTAGEDQLINLDVAKV